MSKSISITRRKYPQVRPEESKRQPYKKRKNSLNDNVTQPINFRGGGVHFLAEGLLVRLSC